MKNIELARKILNQCRQWGISTFCLCPGGRNAPFVELLDKMEGAEVFTFFDERAAGFFALGRAQQLNNPVAVITTSGTAVSELLSPMVEAFYSQTPILAITADRPKNFRGTGAPQVIEQTHVFSSYVEKCCDMDAEDYYQVTWSKECGLQLNICFAEPLIDEEVSSWNYQDLQIQEQNASESLVGDNLVSELFKAHDITRPLLVVGKLSNQEAESLLGRLEKYQCPIYLEGPSGLREAPQLQAKRIKSERGIRRQLNDGAYDGILRIGGVPTAKFWRQIEDYQIPVVSISHSSFSGHPNSLLVSEPPGSGFVNLPANISWNFSQVKSEDEKYSIDLAELFEKFPLSEPTWFQHLAKEIPEQVELYIGNSLPIREWDLAAEPEHPVPVRCNRGANGIDGQLASAFGWSSNNRELWVVLGELTFLYDSSSLSFLTQLGDRKVKVFVINNQGGQIFSRIFSSPMFLNPQSVNMGKLADSFGWSYEKWQQPGQAVTNPSNFTIIEVQPSHIETKGFWEAYDKLWKS